MSHGRILEEHRRFPGTNLRALVRTGFPVNSSVDRSTSAVSDGNLTDQRPNLVPGVSLTPFRGSTINDWINPAALALPAPGTFADVPRNAAHGPGT